MRSKAKARELISEIDAHLAGMEHEIRRMHVDLNTQMARMDHHFKNIMVEVQGLAKSLVNNQLVTVARARKNTSRRGWKGRA